MALFDLINRAERIHRLIRNESTGTPCQFAEKVNLSRRQLYNLLDEFKDFGAEIKYDRTKESFFYVNDFCLEMTVRVINPTTSSENRSFYGGFCENNSASAIWLHGAPVHLLM